MMRRDDQGETPHVLVGDIGGTKTDLALYSLAGDSAAPLARERFSSTAYDCVEAIVHTFLAQSGLPATYACFAVAGPVNAGRVTLTNLPWRLDETELRAALGLRAVWLVNDLLAVASAVPGLGTAELLTLNPGEPAPGGACAVIAPGTGLGEAFLTWEEDHYHAHPSEGGHATFGPADETQRQLAQYLGERFSHLSYERVCSGIGVPNIYAYFRDRGALPESPAVAAQLAATPEHEHARVIFAAASDPAHPCPLCAATLDTFVAILGSAAASLALTVLSTGGLYLTGGIATHIVPALMTPRFQHAFLNHGRFADLLARIPIYVITAADVGLRGAFRCALAQLWVHERTAALSAPA
jgi:glucokinase